MTDPAPQRTWKGWLRGQGVEMIKDLRFLGRGFIILCSLFAFLYLGSVLTLLVNQERLIFKPQPGYPKELPTLNRERIQWTLPTKLGPARGVLWKQPDDPRCLIYLYGNADNIESSLPKIEWISSRFKGSIFMADYPGYGENPGESGQREIQDLLLQWVERLEAQGFKASQRYLWGHSLGGGTASQLAAEVGSRGLILEATFTSLVDMAAESYPGVPIRWICRHPFDSVEALKDKALDVMVIHSVADGVVPFRLGQTLAQELGEEVVKVEGGHSESHLESSLTYTKALMGRWPEAFGPVSGD